MVPLHYCTRQGLGCERLLDRTVAPFLAALELLDADYRLDESLLEPLVYDLLDGVMEAGSRSNVLFLEEPRDHVRKDAEVRVDEQRVLVSDVGRGLVLRPVVLGPTAVVCTENLNPNVVVMKSAQDRVRIDRSDPLNGAIDRRIFVQ